MAADPSVATHLSQPQHPPTAGSPDGSGSDDSEANLPLSRYQTDNSMTSAEAAAAPGLQFPPDVLAPDDQLAPLSTSSTLSWSQQASSRSRIGTSPTSMTTSAEFPPRQVNGNYETVTTPSIQTNGANSSRPTRPTVGRTPSNTYAPARRPSQFFLSGLKSHRSSSSTRTRMNPDAEYRAQKKVYIQRLEQGELNEMGMLGPDNSYPPSLGYSTGSETEDESPSTADYLENDPYDQETLLYYGNDDMQPSVEELKIPANRERLEWHSMLANVLTGDVVRQEKKRLIGAAERQGDNSLQTEVWLGVKAKCCGRTVAAHKRMVEDHRSKIPTLLEAVIAFEIKGEAEVGKSPTGQVEDIVKKIEKCEGLYPTRQALEAAHPRAASDAYKNSCAAVISWHNTTALINVELGVLQAWVGNQELDFQKPRERDPNDSNLADDSSFIDRLLKEDGLKSLQGEGSLLLGVERVINKAKTTLIENAEAYSNRHLPPYIEELLTLINFPSRLVQEVIRTRLSYAKKMKDPAQQGVLMAEQMISQFQILLNLAARIKQAYAYISHPQPGWDLPPCIDENFESVVLDAMKYYFKMLNWKLSANKNTFKEAEILEQEWDFSSELGRHFDGGDVQVAEQFSSLTSRSLQRLTTNFEKELKRRPNEVAGPEMDRRYKGILDSVRVRQRKLFRFSRILTQTFENSMEFSINMEREHLQELYDNLMISGHLLITTTSEPSDKIFFIASPSLQDRPADIELLLGTCSRALENTEDPSNPYILVFCPEEPIFWDGRRLDVDMKSPNLDIKPGKVRLVAEGSQQQLSNAKMIFFQAIKMDLDVIIPQRANLPSVDKELQRIKRTAYKLSNTIMDSVETIRKQLDGLECQELIQNCFAFATEFGQRSVLYMDYNRRALNNLRLTRLALDWVSFICDDCIAYEKKTFRWAVVALEFAMVMTRGQNILSISDEEYAKLRSKVAGCMSLLISHFDIMGARSTVAARLEKQRILEATGGKFRLDISRLKDDEESASLVREQWMAHLEELDETRKQREAERQWLGRVLEDSNEADRSLTYLSASATNGILRWQQGGFVGGGTFGSVYAAINLDSGSLMAVKEIRLQDPQLIPTIVSQIRDEMGVLQILDHPNVVSYHGIEVHRDKVYIFMEYCSGGSLAGLLEHGRIEDETVTKVYALQMLEGLAYLHESGVIHRDIKPENILLDHAGVIKYVDFGAAKIIARQGKTMAPAGPGTPAQRSTQRSMTGTPTYMSPEVIKGTTGNSQGRYGAVDTWSLGCVILEMATGKRPWAYLDNEWAIMYNIAQGNPPQLPTRDQLSDEGIDFLRRCFEKDPAVRASAAELLQHEWIMALKNQLNIEPQTPTDSSSSAGGGSGGPPTRQNTASSGSLVTSPA